MHNVEIDPVVESQWSAQALLQAAKKAATPEAFFPLKPVYLSPGLQVSIRFQTTKPLQPFAIIGTQSLSLRWLELRYERLVNFNAPVFVIQADHLQTIKELKHHYPKLRFIPANGDGIGAELGVQHYPFLVNSSGVWQ